MPGSRSDRFVMSCYAVGGQGQPNAAPQSRQQASRSLAGRVGAASAVAIVAAGGAWAYLLPDVESGVDASPTELPRAAKEVQRTAPQPRTVLTYSESDDEARRPARVQPEARPGPHPSFSGATQAAARLEPADRQDPRLEPQLSSPQSEALVVGSTKSARLESGFATPIEFDCDGVCPALLESKDIAAEAAPLEILPLPPERADLKATMMLVPPRQGVVIADIESAGEAPVASPLGTTVVAAEVVGTPAVNGASDRPPGLAEEAGRLAQGFGDLRLADNRDVEAAADVSQPAATPLAAEAGTSAVKQDIGRHIRALDERYHERPGVVDDASRATAPGIADQMDGFPLGLHERSVTFAAQEGSELGVSSALILEDQLVAIKLADLISLFEERLGRSLFVWLSSSDAASKFVTPASLASAGIEASFDPGSRQVVLAISER
jgi:hypothetical protein